MTLSRAQTSEPLARSDGCCFGKLIECYWWKRRKGSGADQL